jgi:hypothetical protein
MDSTYIVKIRFHSGNVTRSLSLSELDNVGAIVPRLDDSRTVKFYGCNEAKPVYLWGTLTYESEFKNGFYSRNCYLSQSLVDFLLPITEDLIISVELSHYDEGFDTMYFGIEIGLPDKPSTSNDALQFGCIYCNEEGIERQSEIIQPHKSIAMLLSPMIYQHSNATFKGWNDPSLSDFSQSWSQRLVNEPVESFNPMKAWTNINLHYTSNRTGLALALYYLHDGDAQRDIKNGNKHSCLLLSKCILNCIFDEDYVSDNEKKEAKQVHHRNI